MHTLIGICTKNFTILAADKNFTSNILIHKSKESKISSINQSILAYCGEQGEAFRLTSLIIEDAYLVSLNYSVNATPKLLKNIAQNIIHDSLRKKQIGVGLLVAGKADDFELYSIDEYGAVCKGDFFCMGYGAYFGYGILDRYYKEDLSIEEGIEIVRKIGMCMKKRCVIGYDTFGVGIVSDEGIREMELEIK